MEYIVEETKEIKIAGIKIRTDNVEAMSIIPQTWERFMGGNIPEKIENKEPGSGIYAVYTEYESDENGKYDFAIGVVTSKKDQPKGIINITIPGGKYAVFKAHGKEMVVGVWQHIWQSKLKRTFKADFELYDPAGEQIKIFVGIK